MRNLWSGWTTDGLFDRCLGVSSSACQELKLRREILGRGEAKAIARGPQALRQSLVRATPGHAQPTKETKRKEGNCKGKNKPHVARARACTHGKSENERAHAFSPWAVHLTERPTRTLVK